MYGVLCGPNWLSSVRKMLLPQNRFSNPRGIWKKSTPVRPSGMLAEKRSKNNQCKEAIIAPVQMTATATRATAHQYAALVGGLVTLPSEHACTIEDPPRLSVM